LSYNIIVAKYNENVEWSKQFKNVIIYNKGDKLNDEYNQIFLDNVGREGHTYYRYIYDYYDNLEDYTIFLQGNPFDHSPNIINDLNYYINNSNLDIDFKFLSQYILDCNLSGCKHHNGIPLIETYEKLFNEKKTDLPFIFGAGAQFIVSKKNILKRPKSFYHKIIEILQYDVNPIEGFVIERFHNIILNEL
jgi:hypothetical protein